MKDVQKYEGATLFRSERVEPFELAPGVRVAPLLGKHRAGANDQVGLYRNVIEPGCKNPKERHLETQETIVVISGTAKVGLIDHRSGQAQVDGPEAQSVQLVQGDVLTIDPGVWHVISNDSRLTPFVYFCIASPPF